MKAQHRNLSSLMWVTGLLLLGLAGSAAAGTVVVKMGTVAPDGSPWETLLKEMGEQWRTISHGAVQLRIYPGGVLGDESDMVKKLRIGQLQAVGLSGAG